jgi:hypothetical protein
MTKLHECLLPFAEPVCSPRGLRGSELQFLSELKQIVRDIDVVEGFREAGRKFKPSCVSAICRARSEWKSLPRGGGWRWGARARVANLICARTFRSAIWNEYGSLLEIRPLIGAGSQFRAYDRETGSDQKQFSRA